MPAVAYKPKYKIEDYLGWEGEWELWDGIAVSMSPSPDFFHQSVGSNLLSQIFSQLSIESCPAECAAIYECDWHVNDLTVVRPDVMIVCEKPEGRWVEKRPEFVAEILSPSTRHKDLTAKRELYAVNRVPFYLVVDPEEKSATLLKLDEEGTYRDLPPEEAFELHPGCSLKLSVAPLFA